jgi:hypothetical protein
MSCAVSPKKSSQAAMNLRDSSADLPRSGKIFKFYVYFEDDYDARSEKNSGKFNGQVKVDGLHIGPATAFESIRDELKKKGYKITEQTELSYAKKSGPWGQILIFKSVTSGKSVGLKFGVYRSSPG